MWCTAVAARSTSTRVAPEVDGFHLAVAGRVRQHPLGSLLVRVSVCRRHPTHARVVGNSRPIRQDGVWISGVDRYSFQ